MLNAIPVIGWLLSLVFTTSVAVPFWIVWSACGIGSKYFYWLPEVYQRIPFWNCVGLFMVIGILKSVLTPKLVEVSQKVEKEGK